MWKKWRDMGHEMALEMGGRLDLPWKAAGEHDTRGRMLYKGVRLLLVQALHYDKRRACSHHSGRNVRRPVRLARRLRQPPCGQTRLLLLLLLARSVAARANQLAHSRAAVCASLVQQRLDRHLLGSRLRGGRLAACRRKLVVLGGLVEAEGLGGGVHELRKGRGGEGTRRGGRVECGRVQGELGGRAAADELQHNTGGPAVVSPSAGVV